MANNDKFIIGHGGGGKSGQGSGAVEDRNTLRSMQTAQVLDLICEGPIDGLVDGLRSIYLDDVPLQNDDGSYNFANVAIDWRNGLQDQPTLGNFPDEENTYQVGVKVWNNVPIYRAINDANVDAVRVTLSVPTLTTTNQSSGDVHGASVLYAIDVADSSGTLYPSALNITPAVAALMREPRNIFGGGDGSVLNGTLSFMLAALFLQGKITQTDYNNAVTTSFDGKTTSKYQRSHVIPLHGRPPFSIRVRRISTDATSTLVQNDLYFDSYTEIINSKLTYPNCAYFGIAVDAAQFSSIPVRSYDLRLLHIQVPSNYNPETRVYNGPWDGTFKIAWSNNPVWCFYDMLTNDRYGCGSFIDAAQIDKWGLYSIGQYCDEPVADGFGHYEPRFTCNMYIPNRADAYKVLNDLATIFRGMIYWASGSVVATQDAPSDPVYQFTAANVIDGTFSYSGVSSKQRHTVAKVTWIDPLLQYKPNIEYIDVTEFPDGQALIDRYGYVETEVAAMGCTSRGQAHRIGKWLLYTEMYQTETVTFRTGLEGIIVRPGQIIQIADPLRANTRFGGRLAGCTSTQATLDALLTLDSGTYSLTLSTSSGGLQTVSVYISNSGDVGTLTFSSAISDVPPVDSVWLLASTQVEPQLFRVINAAEVDNQLVEVTALAHNPSKYATVEDGAPLQTYAIRQNTPAGVQPVTNVVVDERQYYGATGNLLNKLVVTWNPSSDPFLKCYNVDWRPQGGNWQSLPQTNGQQIEIDNVQPGNYDARVTTVSTTGKTAVGVVGSYVVQGKTAATATVAGLTVTSKALELDIGVGYTDTSDTDLCEILAATVNDRTQATVITTLAYPASSFTWANLTAYTTYYFWARVRDTSKNYSAYFPVSSTAGVSGTTKGIATTDIQDGAVIAAKIQDAAVSITKFASGLTPVQIVSALPASGSEGQVVTLTTDGKLYRYHSGAWTAAVAAPDISGQLAANQIATGAIDTSKLASGLTVPSTATSLPSSGTEGQLIQNTTDGKLYRYHSGAWTAAVPTADLSGAIQAGQIAANAVQAGNIAAGVVGNTQLATNAVDSSKIANGAVTTAAFAQGIKPVTVVSALPASGNVQGDVVLLTTDNQLYRYTGSAWTATVPAANVTGSIPGSQISAGTITNTQIGANSIATGNIQAGAITANSIAAGTITGNNIAANAITAGNLAANTITGDKIAANTLTAGNLAANTITAGQIAAGAIGAQQIAAGAITTDKLYVGTQGAAINANPSTDDLTAWSGLNTAGLSVVSGTTFPSGPKALLMTVRGDVGDSRTYPVDQRKTYAFHYNYNLATSTTGYAFVSLYDSNGAQISGDGAYWFYPSGQISGDGTWHTVDATFGAGTSKTFPTNAVTMRVGFIANYQITGGNGGNQYWQNLILQEVLPGTLIQNGAITTNKIAAQAVTATQIAANTITASQIAAGTIQAAQIAAGTIQANNIAAGTITGGTIAASTITGTNIAAGTITANNIAAGTITANNIATGTITAAQIAGGTITSSQMQNGTVTATQIAGGTITTNQIAANTITGGNIAGRTITANNLVAGTITANEIATGTITANNILGNTITGAQIQAGAINTTQLAAGAVTANVLAVTAKNLANNWTTSGQTSGFPSNWSTSLSGVASLGTDSSAGGPNAVVLTDTNTGNNQITSDQFDIDPTKTYRFSVALNDNGAGPGTRYFGLNVYDASGTELAIIPFTVSNRTSGAAATNPYFWLSGGTVSGSYHTYQPMEGYLVPDSTLDANMPQGLNVNTLFKMPANARRACMRVLNYYNNGTSNTAKWLNPQVTDVDSGVIYGSSIVSNSLAADRITSGTIGANTIYLSNNKFVLDGANQNLTVSDGTRNRVQIGSLGGGNYGLELWDASGNVFLNSGGVTNAPWASVTGTGKPADNATNTTNTNQLTDGAGLGTKATWSGVTGTGKPADNADVTSANTAAGIANQGAFATMNKIPDTTQGVPSTYIGNLSVGSLHIQNNAVSTYTTGSHIPASGQVSASATMSYVVSMIPASGPMFAIPGNTAVVINFWLEWSADQNLNNKLTLYRSLDQNSTISPADTIVYSTYQYGGYNPISITEGDNTPSAGGGPWAYKMKLEYQNTANVTANFAYNICFWQLMWLLK